jgi:HNH endonuclease
MPRSRLEGIEARGDERWPTKLSPFAWSELGVIFYSNITKSNNCWLWTGREHPTGYGIVRHKRRYYYTHRLSWMLHHKGREIPGELHCLHKCNNKLCVRPSHIYLGTPADNVRDREVAKDAKRKELRETYETWRAQNPPRQPEPFNRRL